MNMRMHIRTFCMDVGAVMQYSAYLNAVFRGAGSAQRAGLSLWLEARRLYLKGARILKWFFQNVSHELKNADDGCSGLRGGHPHRVLDPAEASG